MTDLVCLSLGFFLHFFLLSGNVLNARPTAAYLLNAERKVFGATSSNSISGGS